MRCKCGNPMTPYDMARKFPASGEYVGVCGECWHHIKDFVTDLELEKEDSVPTQQKRREAMLAVRSLKQNLSE